MKRKGAHGIAERPHRRQPVVTADFIARATFILDAELARDLKVRKRLLGAAQL